VLGLGLLPAELVWCFIGDLASGLAFIHARGIVHMDVKPQVSCMHTSR
jgi:serine/threonine protein kinase